MSSQLIKHFDRIGARVKIRKARLDWAGGHALAINILRDSGGEYFDIEQPRDLCLDAVDIRSQDRHLLLVAQGRGVNRVNPPANYLCGHDEQHWFVAAVPEKPGVRNVETAKDALIPPAVRDVVERMKLPRNLRYTRHNRAFVRQGEWFFVLAPDAPIDARRILHDEPIRRGGGKPHFCQELFRIDGEKVYVRFDFPNGLREREYHDLDPKVKNRAGWQVMQRDATVFVRGSVRHPDHATIWLADWHRVFMNEETKAKAMRHVAFLD